MLKIEVIPGISFSEAAKNTCKTASFINEEILITFNDIDITINPKSSWKDICTIYDLKCQLRRAQR